VRRRRLLAAGIGAGVLLTAVPALAEVERGSGAASSATSGEARALALLERAALAGRGLTYSGTQYATSWRTGGSSSALLELRHDPRHGSVLTAVSGSEQEALRTPSTAVLDPRMLTRLVAAYALEVRGPGRCAGRAASVVDARRTDGQLAGRFWVDQDTGVLLRREVFDGDGRRVRSSAFVELDVAETSAESSADSTAGSSAPVQRVAPAAWSGRERPAPEAVARLRDAGWHVPEDLPQGFRLFETRREDQVLHLAYTDGLSTLSLFAQDGQLGSSGMAGFTAEQVEGRPVWVRRSAPERVVWSGGDRVWTLVSDAPEDAVLAVVAALPRDAPPDSGLPARLARGLSRLAGMLNPFG
jgi:negative regulator of sigma E activity